MKSTKTILTFVGFVAHLILRSQTPELIYTHSYGIEGSNLGNETTSVISLLEDGSFLVGGVFYSDAEIALIGTDSILTGTNTGGNGMWVKYSSEDEVVSSHSFAQVIRQSDYFAPGLYYAGGTIFQQADFDLTGSNPVVLSPIIGTFSSFIAIYNDDNELFWVNTISGSTTKIHKTPDYFFCTGQFSSDCYITTPSDTVVIPEYVGSAAEGLAVIFDMNGEMIDYNTFSSDGNNFIFDSDYSSTLSEYSVAGRSVNDMDFQWNGDLPSVVPHSGEAAFVATYNETLELSSLLIITNQDAGQQDNANCSAIQYDNDGNIYAGGYLEEGSYTLKLNGYEEEIIANSANELFLLKLSPQKELMWVRHMPVDGSSWFRKIFIDHNGFVNAGGQYYGSIQFPENGPLYYGGSEAAFIGRWTPDGELVWGHSIGFVGQNSVESMFINPENEMYLGGYFSYNSADFDLTDGLSILGPAVDEDAYLAKYSISNPLPQVFIEQSWQSSNATEGGATDNIYVRLASVPSSAVTVTVTPNAQLNLGVGAGNAITLTFPANENAILQQTITVVANDDAAVEGAHTGNIAFDINSNDSSYNGIAENDIEVAITDNDIISVNERTQPELSISPNPANDQLKLIFGGSNSEANTMAIYDLTGKLIMREKITSTTMLVNIAELANGQYSLVLEKDENVLGSTKFVVAKD